jgi:hypothetical protein
MAIDNNAETPKFITTEEEIEGSQIKQFEILPASRIVFRDTIVFLDIIRR